MANPYIVKETDPYTIKKFVTGRPLDSDEATVPDEHGVYPVSPLGFLYEDVETLPDPLPDTGFVSSPSDSAEILQKITDSGNMYKVASSPAVLRGTGLIYRITSLAYSENGYTMVVAGHIVEEQGDQSSYLTVLNTDASADYSALGIIGTRFLITWDTESSYDAELDETTVVIPASRVVGWKLSGTVGSGRISARVEKKTWVDSENTERYAYCTGENVIYKVGNDDDSDFSVRLRINSGSSTGSAYTSDDLVSTAADCNGNSHIRKGYSDREVMEWVESKAGGFISSGVHPASTAGVMTDAGALTRWFASSGKVDVSGGMRHPVMVNGFGLGYGYYGASSSTEQSTDSRPRYSSDGTSIDYHSNPIAGTVTGSDRYGYVEHPKTGHPVITFGYGAASDSKFDSDTAALPLDWPLGTPGASVYTNNNITFVGKSVNVSGQPRGGMIDVVSYDVCPDCGGTGHVDGNVCEICNGTGEIDPVTVDANRAHVCIFNDFDPKDSSDTEHYSSGTTVLKKTFVHLATPIDTDDGAEYELTVSIPAVDTDSAFGSDDPVKNLSAYYAYVSQPRVYVLGGRWKFSNTRLKVTKPSSVESPFTLTGEGTFLGSDGNAVPEGTRVRFTLSAMRMTPSSTEFVGTLVSNGDTYGITVSGEFPYDVSGRGWVDDDLYICGLAYCDMSEDHNNSDTPLGLVSRNDTTVDSPDYGTGAAGSLNNYNSFFSIGESEGRTRISQNTDQRYVLATVYPTATNTFPWALSGRRKLANSSRLMTESGVAYGSVLDMAWRANRKLVSLVGSALPLEPGKMASMRSIMGWNARGVLKGWTPSVSSLAYSIDPGTVTSDSPVLPRALRVSLPKLLGKKYSESECDTDDYKVVKQAIRAISELSADFGRLRLAYPGASIAKKTYIPANTGMDDFVWNTKMFPNTYSLDESSAANALWNMRIRHSPEYIYDGSSSATPDSVKYSYNSLYPFNDECRDMYREFNQVRYKSDECDATTADTEEVPCDITSKPSSTGVFKIRSVIQHLLETVPDIVTSAIFQDIYRESEAQYAELGTDADRIEHPYRYRYGSTDAKTGLYEIADAYTKIMSIDGVPVPAYGLSLDDVLPKLSEKQRPFIGMDAFGSYRYECADGGLDDDFDFVSSRMPSDDTSLSQVLRTYNPFYSSGLPMRSWDSFRVHVHENGITKDSNREIYYTRVKWLAAELDSCESLKLKYAQDMFARNSAGKVLDPNPSWSYVDSGTDGSVLLESNCSVPPGTVTRDIYRKIGQSLTTNPGGSSYIRVFMKFVFSAKAGRWYCTDYRQAPVSYLTPLYGAKALGQTMPSIYRSNGEPADVRFDSAGKVSTDSVEPVWTQSICGGYTWQDAMMHPYYMYYPMNVTAGVVPFLFKNFPYKPTEQTGYTAELATDDASRVAQENDDYTAENYMSRLDRPHLPYGQGGVGLYTPADCNGGYSSSAVSLDSSHANFWSVRMHLRPAVSAMPGTDIPGVSVDSYDGTRTVSRTGGTISDPTLWGQFSYPAKNVVEYHMPDPENPLFDTLDTRINYYDDAEFGNVQSGNNSNVVYAFKEMGE